MPGLIFQRKVFIAHLPRTGHRHASAHSARPAPPCGQRRKPLSTPAGLKTPAFAPFGDAS